MTSIAPYISAFLQDHLAIQRGTSGHTCDTYAHSFKLLFEFASEKLGVAPSKMYLEQIDAPMVSSFLEYLQTVRGNSPSTRNARLAAIKSFFRFLEYRLPAVLDQIRRILAIPFKKTDTRLVPHLTKDETQAILDQPNPTTRFGIRDRAMIHVALAAGLRVSELIGLRMDDLTLEPTPCILVRGKGRRERALPLWKETAATLQAWLAIREDQQVPEIFVNARGEKMSRWGVAYVLEKHAKAAGRRCPSLRRKRVSPHVLRHTCAMIVLQATNDIRKVSLWLGHSTIKATDIYTRTDPSEKLDAISAITPPKLRKGRFSPSDKLIALLKTKWLCGVRSIENECHRTL